jgi:hypothetical protein
MTIYNQNKKMISRSYPTAIILLLTINLLYSQESKILQQGVTAEQNLKAIVNITPYSPGGIGFDTRFEGTKGSPRLYDTLLHSILKIKGQKDYFELETDIDPYSNSLVFSYPKGAKLQSIPADMVTEVIITLKGENLVYRTDEGKKFDKSAKDNKFFQVLMDQPYLFIKMPVKTFTEADYKAAYSIDRRYNEFGTIYRYYILTNDGIYHKIQLSKKSLAKLFPDKKDFINKFSEDGSYADDEELIKAIVSKL